MSSTPRRYQVLTGPQRRLLVVVWSLVAVLGANSAYLGGVTFLSWWRQGEERFEGWFYPWMILFHIVFGLLLVPPLVVFGVTHWRRAHTLPNRRCVRMGQAMFLTALGVLGSGVVLMLFELGTASPARNLVYWLHVLAPLACVWLYVLHRLAGPPIRWRLGVGWAGLVGASLAAMALIHAQDPRRWSEVGPEEGLSYFFPSLSRTATGKYIPARTLMNDQYCLQCHADVHQRWRHSAHRFSSFNNPAYRFSVRETRKAAGIKKSRFCAGCHDPVPFFSGAFDDPNYDDVDHPTAHAGITCTVCHSIVAVNSPRGNGDYTIEEPLHYPFAFSGNPLLRYINRQLIKAKPSFHKKTFLKPLHKTAEFCSTCHKVHLPEELNSYRFLRGQNHYDSFVLSGVSGGGARSFYYPESAHANCNGCHMPARESDDFAAKLFEGASRPSVHDHLFLGANTALGHWRGRDDILRAHQRFLKDCLRVDIFGLREGTDVTAALTAPLRPKLPVLKPGRNYVLEVVVRTLTLGHHFTQGTADSNEVWLEVTVRSGQRVIGRSGGVDSDGQVDPWSYFLNTYMLDRHGNRIDRRNAQDIFVPLYNHQIPPGASRLARFALQVPKNAYEPITIEVRARYRKFDQKYMRYVFGQEHYNDLPITDLARDRIVLPVAQGPLPEKHESPIPAWQRWNDFGIAQLVEAQGGSKVVDFAGALRAFREVERLGRPDGLVNQARVHLQRGLVPEANTALIQAAKFDPPPYPWTLAWLNARVFERQGRFDLAAKRLRSVLSMRTLEMRERGLDFSRDYLVINQLGKVLFEQSKTASGPRRERLLKEAIGQFKRSLEIDPENVEAHYNLSLLYDLAGQRERAAEHRAWHEDYKLDEAAREKTIRRHVAGNPAANLAANPGAIHPVHAVANEPPKQGR